MTWVWDPQTTPDLGGVSIKSEDALAEPFDDDGQPSLKTLRLVGVAAPMDEFDATAQFANRDGGQINRLARRGATSSKKATTPLFALALFLASLTTLVSIKYMRRTPGRVYAFEVRVQADGRHRGQNLGEAASAGTRQRLSQDGAMFRFRAAAMRPGALLERPDEFLIDPAYEQIWHIFRAPIV